MGCISDIHPQTPELKKHNLARQKAMVANLENMNYTDPQLQRQLQELILELTYAEPYSFCDMLSAANPLGEEYYDELLDQVANSVAEIIDVYNRNGDNKKITRQSSTGKLGSVIRSWTKLPPIKSPQEELQDAIDKAEQDLYGRQVEEFKACLHRRHKFDDNRVSLSAKWNAKIGELAGLVNHADIKSSRYAVAQMQYQLSAKYFVSELQKHEPFAELSKGIAAKAWMVEHTDCGSQLPRAWCRYAAHLYQAGLNKKLVDLSDGCVSSSPSAEPSKASSRLKGALEWAKN